MKIYNIKGASLILILLLSLPGILLAASREAQIPSGVEKYPNQYFAQQKGSRQLLIYTHDSSADVSSFYKKTLDMEPVIPDAFLIGHDVLGENSEEVWLKIISEPKQLSEEDLYDFLEREILIKHLHTQSELEEVKQKYTHLLKAWYPNFEAKKKLKSCNEEIDQRTKNIEAQAGKLSKKSNQRAMVAEMQKLIAQGRQQELGKLANDLASQQKQLTNALYEENRTDHWDKWIQCLDELDKYDVKTKIVIDMYLDDFIPSTESERRHHSKRTLSRKQG